MTKRIVGEKSYSFAIKIVEMYKQLAELSLLKDTGYIHEEVYQSINNPAIEIVKLPASIVKITTINLGR